MIYPIRGSRRKVLYSFLVGTACTVQVILWNPTIFLGPTNFLWNRICEFRFRKHSTLYRCYHNVEENGCVETKKLIVPPKNIPCFDAHKDTPRISFFIAFSQDVQVFLMEKASQLQHPCLRLSRVSSTVDHEQ